MKIFTTILLSLFVVCNLSAQASATANEAISVNGITTVNLDLESENIEIKETRGSRIIIESHVTLESINNNSLLDFLISSGRYHLENKVDASTHSITITRKKNNNILVVKGEECKELLRYVILIPSSVKIINTTSTTASK